jgi:hypothetical protein
LDFKPDSEMDRVFYGRKNSGEVWYLLAKDEEHGFRKKTNRDFYIWSEVLFLEKYLLAPEIPLRGTLGKS